MSNSVVYEPLVNSTQSLSQSYHPSSFFVLHFLTLIRDQLISADFNNHFNLRPIKAITVLDDARK